MHLELQAPTPTQNKLTYISLFSSAGVGCYGFKEAGFECVATNELIPRRLEIQKCNNKCRYESGYICGDITQEETKAAIKEQIEKWRINFGINDIDVVIATPPCQGMSVANHKKTCDEIRRNSLVVESIKMVLQIKPKFFVFENVPAFIKTICTDTDDKEKQIGRAIQRNLGGSYSFTWRVINFKDYGACSSRSRTLVIGVRRDIADAISPYDLFPERRPEKTLREVIGKLPRLSEMGEIAPHDIFHAFRPYPEHMREWIHDLREGQSAFDQESETKRPHKVENGRIVENKNKNGDKYRRQCWDKVGPCVHTRNDQLASQNTIHPEDDRVFSIRELMLMMSVPHSFRWLPDDEKYLSALPVAEQRVILKREEIKIRQSLGEAVPTAIFLSIAGKIKKNLSRKGCSNKEVEEIANKIKLFDGKSLNTLINENPDNYSLSSLMRIAELANSKRTETSAYYTNKSIITEILQRLPDVSSEKITVLEPAVGVGSFIPLIAKRFETKQVCIDVVDIDKRSIEIFQALLPGMDLPDNVSINIITDDFLLHDFNKKYDYVIGNPPFGKASPDKLKSYLQHAKNTATKNLFSFFLDKCIDLGRNVALVLPKSVLNAPEFRDSRREMENARLISILDFGEKGFKGVLVETVALILQPGLRPASTSVFSMTTGEEETKLQSYITDNRFPYWIIYRNDFFDRVADSLEFDVFTVFRDRQITTADLDPEGDIWVVKSRNLEDSGKALRHLPGYDSRIRSATAEKLAVYKYLNAENVYMFPNMTYNPRVIPKPKGSLVNGSVALLFPRNGAPVPQDALEYLAGEEYRRFYKIARNRQTRSLNLDSCSVFFLGLKRKPQNTQHIHTNPI